MSDMYDLPTGTISIELFNAISRTVKRHFPTWEERFQWKLFVLDALPISEQEEILVWARSKAVSINDEAMLVLIVFFHAALREYDYRKGMSDTAIRSLYAKLHATRTARGSILPEKITP